MKKTIQIIMPETWADITLKQYLALQYDLEAYKDDEEAIMSFMMIHLCGLSVEDISGLSRTSYNQLKESILSLKPEKLLYDIGFPNEKDQQLMTQFHKTEDWSKKVNFKKK